MKKAPWRCFLLYALLWVMPHAIAQQHNVGYYEKIHQDGNASTYQLVWSAYVPGAEHEPPQPGDFYIPPGGGGGGGGCSNPPHCQVQGGYGGLQSQILPPIVVTGSSLGAGKILSWLTTVQGSGGGELRGRIVEHGPNQPSPSCDEESFTPVLDGFLTPDEKSRVTSFLNSEQAQDLWDDSNYIPGMTAQRREQVGFLLPSGSFQRAQNVESTPCSANFSNPGPLPQGTILVHTHPWRRFESTGSCSDSWPGDLYLNTPGHGDAAGLGTLGLGRGLIMDGDGIIVFTPDYHHEDAPSEAHFESDQCGFDR